MGNDDEIVYIRSAVSGLSDKIEKIQIEVAKLSTQIDMFIKNNGDCKSQIEKHEEDCPARKSVEEFKNQMIKLSVKLLISYIAVGAAAIAVAKYLF